ncbi:MAG: HEAT repeat domain-containing protein [Phycisphaerae bacterium]
MNKRMALLGMGAWVASAMAPALVGCAPAMREDRMRRAELILASETGKPEEQTLEAMAQLLDSDDLAVRAAAAQALGARAAAGNPYLVLPAVSHADSLVRGVAQAAYIERSPDGLAPLAVNGSFAEVAPKVLTALGELDDPQGMPDLKALISAKRAELRSALGAGDAEAVLAADLLARIGDAGARRALLRLADSDQPTVCARVALACVRHDTDLGPTLLPTLFEGDAVVRRAVMQALVLRPDPRLKGLVTQGLDDPDRGVRHNAIRAAGNLGAAGLVGRLADKLAGPRPEKHDVIQALGAIGRPAAATLRRYILDGPPSEELLVEAVLALAPHAGRDDIPWISRLLDSPNKHVRSAAASALGRIGHPAAQAALMGVIDDPEPLVRATVARALGQIGTLYGSKQLVLMLKDPSPLVRSLAASGLGESRYPDAVPDLAKMAGTVSPSVEKLLRVGGVYGRPEQAAIRALGRIGGTEAVAVLLEALESPSWLLRATAAEALGEAGAATPEAIEALEKRLDDPINLVRARALLSLETLGKTFPPGHFQKD